MTRTVILVSGRHKRTYPVPNSMELKDTYDIDGRRWTVTAVITSEDVPINQPLATR